MFRFGLCHHTMYDDFCLDFHCNCQRHMRVIDVTEHGMAMWGTGSPVTSIACEREQAMDVCIRHQLETVKQMKRRKYETAGGNREKDETGETEKLR